MLGMQPTRDRSSSHHVAIRYTVQPSDLGWVLLAATQRGICAIELSDSPEAAIAALQSRFPKAQLQPNDAELDHWAATVIAWLHAPHQPLALPLDVQGTDFQRQVWQALQAIPPGETASYAEIARRLGHPKSARAVARACATNTIAVAIPCHRVVGSNGTLTGYRWGIHRKQALLAREAAYATRVAGGNSAVVLYS